MLIESAAGDEKLSIESEFAATIKYIDLYLRQKTDLFLQNYVFEPFEFLAKNLMFLSVIVPLLAAGVILLIATMVPLRADLMITGASIFIMGGIIAYVLFSNTIILQTPTGMEMVKRGKA